MAEDEIKGNTKTANLQLTRFDLHYDSRRMLQGIVAFITFFHGNDGLAGEA